MNPKQRILLTIAVFTVVGLFLNHFFETRINAELAELNYDIELDNSNIQTETIETITPAITQSTQKLEKILSLTTIIKIVLIIVCAALLVATFFVRNKKQPSDPDEEELDDDFLPFS